MLKDIFLFKFKMPLEGSWKDKYSGTQVEDIPTLQYLDEKPDYEALRNHWDTLYNVKANSPSDLYKRTASVQGDGYENKMITELEVFGFSNQRENSENLRIIFQKILEEVRSKFLFLEDNSEEVNQNATNVNQLQKEIFFSNDYIWDTVARMEEQGCTYNDIDQFMSMSKSLEKDWDKYMEGSLRRICFYTRHALFDPKNLNEPYGNINNIEMAAFYYGMNWYISNGYSPLYSKNSLKLLTRLPNYYPHFLNDLVPELDYQNIRGFPFIFYTGIGANVVQLAHGRSHYWTCLNSMQANGTAVRMDKSANDKKYRTEIPLKYKLFDNSPPPINLSETTCEGSLVNVMREGIQAVIDLETAVLKNTANGRVWNY